MGEPNAGAELRVAMAVTAFWQRGDAPGDADNIITLMLPSQRSMILEDSEIEMQDHLGAWKRHVDNADDHGLPPECPRMLHDIVIRTNLDVFVRAFLGHTPARVGPMTVRLRPGARVVRTKPPLEHNHLP